MSAVPLWQRTGRFATAFVVCALHIASARADGAALDGASAGRPPDLSGAQTVADLLAELDRDPAVVIADIGGRPVTRADVAAAVRAIPPALAVRPAMEVYQQAAGIAMQQKVLAVRAVDAGLDKLPSVIFRLRATDEDVLADTYLRGALDANLTEDVLKRGYERLVAGRPGAEEVKARIIVTDSEKDAGSAIERINAGTSFDDVARSDSTDVTAASGGDLGYISPAGLASEVAAVLFALPVGGMTAHPVQSGSHWFVIRSEGRRVRPTPTFDEARQDLAHGLAVVEIARIKQQAVTGAKIIYRGILADAAPGAGTK